MTHESTPTPTASGSLYQAARACLLERDPDRKLALTDRTVAAWEAGGLALEGWTPADAVLEAGRPSRPELVHPNRLPRITSYNVCYTKLLRTSSPEVSR